MNRQFYVHYGNAARFLTVVKFRRTSASSCQLAASNRSTTGTRWEQMHGFRYSFKFSNDLHEFDEMYGEISS
jgi:hypothetical protein